MFTFRSKLLEIGDVRVHIREISALEIDGAMADDISTAERMRLVASLAAYDDDGKRIWPDSAAAGAAPMRVVKLCAEAAFELMELTAEGN